MICEDDDDLSQASSLPSAREPRKKKATTLLEFDYSDDEMEQLHERCEKLVRKRRRPGGCTSSYSDSDKDEDTDDDDSCAGGSEKENESNDHAERSKQSCIPLTITTRTNSR